MCFSDQLRDISIRFAEGVKDLSDLYLKNLLAEIWPSVPKSPKAAGSSKYKQEYRAPFLEQAL